MSISLHPRHNLPSSLRSSPDFSDIVQAAQSRNCADAARKYAAMGFSVLPLRGKVPALRSWKLYQTTAAPPDRVEGWIKARLFQNVGIVCGDVSGGLVVLDLDGEAAYVAFSEQFPSLIATYTVATGSGHGRHLYYRCTRPPPSIRALHTAIGNIELCSNGRQITAPPSIHPRTGQPYTNWQPLDILVVPHLDAVSLWIDNFQTYRKPVQQQKGTTMDSTSHVQSRLFEALTTHFLALGYRRNGDWLNGTCIYPERHRHGDAKPSFGFNTVTGYGHCFLCGSMLAREIAKTLGVIPNDGTLKR